VIQAPGRPFSYAGRRARDGAQLCSKLTASPISRSATQSSQKLERNPEIVSDPSLGEPH
jgi:hypothetical protein